MENIARFDVYTKNWFKTYSNITDYIFSDDSDEPLHRDGDKPAFIAYNNKDDVILEEWFFDGKLHRTCGLPAVIKYCENGNIIEKRYYIYGNVQNDLRDGIL